jgi:hypothetical protein
MRMHTLDPNVPAGSKPEPLSSRIFVRCYRHYGDAKRAYDALRVVAGIPEKRMTVVARGLEWREPLPAAALLKLASGAGAAVGGIVGLVLWMFGFTASQTGWLSQTILGALAGVFAGLVAAIVAAWLRRDRTGIAATGHVEPRQYDILVEEDLAPVARELLEAD